MRVRARSCVRGGCGHASAIAIIAHVRAHRARENSIRLGRVCMFITAGPMKKL